MPTDDARPSPPPVSRAHAAWLLEDVLNAGRHQALEPGDVIAGHELLSLLGEGGFGVVWRARQPPPLSREVALKLIKPGIDSEEVLARFQREQRVLARLQHPGIATVLGAGLTEDERPYIVMELVEGPTLTAFCQQQDLDLSARVELLRQVCSALQHAHEKGVIHRDLKPSNVLVCHVDGRPQPKIIDFGIAKALSHEEGRDVTWMTRQQRLIGTPAYMSPEQTQRDGITEARTDIYALGVLLFELITGQPLFDPSLSVPEKLRHIREVHPDRPSRRCQRVAASRDLDWITLRCLEKEPVRRYATVEALNDDLANWQQGRAVSAHPPSRSYRFQRWLHRHRALAAALVIVVMAIATGTTLAFQQWRSAQINLREAEAVEQALILSLEKASATKTGHAPRAYDMARQVLEQIRAGQFPGSAATRRALLKEGSRAALAVSDHPTALWALEHSLALAESLPEVSPTELAHDRLNLLGRLLNAERNAEAVAKGQLWLPLTQAQLGIHHYKTVQLQSMTAEAMRAEGISGFLELQQDAAAKALHLPDRKIIAEIQSYLLRAFNTAGKHQEALDLADRLLPELQTLHGTNDSKVWFTRGLKASYLLKLGRREEGLALMHEVHARQKDRFGSDHPHTQWTARQLQEAGKEAGPP